MLIETLQNLFVSNFIIYFVLLGKTSLNNLQKSFNIVSLLLNGLITLASILAIILTVKTLKEEGVGYQSQMYSDQRIVL